MVRYGREHAEDVGLREVVDLGAFDHKLRVVPVREPVRDRAGRAGQRDGQDAQHGEQARMRKGWKPFGQGRRRLGFWGIGQILRDPILQVKRSGPVQYVRAKMICCQKKTATAQT